MSASGSARVVVELSAVIVAVRDDTPRVLVVTREGRPALPSGELDPNADHTLDRAMRRWSAEQTGLALGFVEQLYTFGDPSRDPNAAAAGERRLSVAYLAFVRDIESPILTAPAAHWVDVYDLLPWEDHRAGDPGVMAAIRPAIEEWVDRGVNDDERAGRGERADLSWGTGGARWDPVRSLERFELLYDAGLVGESAPARMAAGDQTLGTMAALDHRRVLASALGRLRGKLTYRPVVFELLPPAFTLSQLQHVVEALAGVTLHKQNFRRLVEGAGLVDGTGERTATTGGRPAELFRFRREVLRERPAPGMNLPGRR